jgi:hypothetical protein
MQQAFNCHIKEINLKDFNGVDSIYKNDAFFYNIVITTNVSNLLVDNMSLIELFVKTENHVIFKFKNMHKYYGKNYKKFSESYTQIDLFPANQILHISYYGYVINGDEESKEIFEVIEIGIEHCPIIDNFLHFLYTKYKKIWSGV